MSLTAELTPMADRPAGSFLDALLAELGSQVVLIGDDIPIRNEKDWSILTPVRPMAVARPGTTEEVAAVMRLCASFGVPVVPQGGLTGLCGEALPVPNCVALSFERMMEVEEIDSAAATMTVRAGTTLEAVQRAADEAGFFMPLDLGARGSCAIGGNLSTNAGGNRVIRYGMAREMVLGLEVVLPDGTIVCNLNKMLKNNGGTHPSYVLVEAQGIVRL